MDMKNWAENEIDIACKRENPDWDGESFDYGVACYQSALKAYKSLLEDNHSGFSWSMTKEILIRLMDGHPLTPITDEDFDEDKLSYHESEDFLNERGLKSSIQCYRQSSLFREETLDGKVTYSDIDRYYCCDINNTDNTYSGGGACKIIDELFPITMPYYSQHKKYVIYTEEFSIDKEMGDFDTQAYHYIITPNGDKVEVNRFYKEVKDGEPITETIQSEHFVPDGEPDDNGDIALKRVIEEREHTYQPTKWIQISKEEFYERKKHKIEDFN